LIYLFTSIHCKKLRYGTSKVKVRLLPKAISLLLFLNLLFPFLLYAASQSSKDELKQLQDLRFRINTLQKNLVEKEASKTEAADALRDSERSISNIHHMLAKLAHQQNEIQNKLAQLRDQSTQLWNQVSVKQDQLGKLVYYQHLTGSEDYLHLLLKQQDPNEITRKLHYYSYIARARSENIDNLRDELAVLDALARESHAQNETLRQIEKQQLSQKIKLEQEKKKRENILATISEEITLQQKEISKLKQDEQRLSDLVTQLRKLLAQRKSAASIKSGDKPLIRNDRLPDNTKQIGAFAALKGKLRLPVRGELVNRFGTPREGGSIKWKGLFIRSQGGNEVKAIANGQVVFADWLRGFGNLMILDHGNHYMSLYGNNEAIYKRVGDKVRSGDTIAAVGNSGGNSESGLYFELRYQGKAFDPLIWVKIE
jgi:septal ring factor EnvC (AmiA/AmiB activator)